MMELGYTLVPQFTQRLKTGIFNVALGWAFQFFAIDEKEKTGIFYIRSCLVRDLVDKFMLFTHLYLMQEEKIEAWFLFPASREYFGVEKFFVCQQIHKKSTHF